MVKIIMHGCNGKMGQVITGIVAGDPDAEIVAGIDVVDNRDNGYPVFTDIDACDVEADVIIDFAAAVAVDKLLDYGVRTQTPIVLCTTGLSDEQLAKVKECSAKVAILKSANMSLGINTLMKLLKDAASGKFSCNLYRALITGLIYTIRTVAFYYHTSVKWHDKTVIGLVILIRSDTHIVVTFGELSCAQLVYGHYLKHCRAEQLLIFLSRIISHSYFVLAL